VKKISVTMAYYNRPDYLRRTLVAYYNIHRGDPGCEFIIVDDGSRDDLRAALVAKEFEYKLDIKVFYRENKDDINPAVAINSSVKLASEEIVIITNPETIPVTPIIYQLNSDQFQDNEYIIVPCYSIPLQSQNAINQIDVNNEDYVKEVLNFINFNSRGPEFEGDDAWYSHSIYRYVLFYFTAVIRKKYFFDIGGIDEEFRYGWGYEDTDFVERLQINQPKISFLTDAVCLHQFHYNNSEVTRDDRTRYEGVRRNRELYLLKKESRESWKK